MVGISVLTGIVNGSRIDAAEKRINQNTVATVQLEAQNAAQNEVRDQLVAAFKKADMRACLRIETLKAQNRIDARDDFARLGETLALLGIAPTPQIEARAREDLNRTLERNRPRSCAS